MSEKMTFLRVGLAGDTLLEITIDAGEPMGCTWAQFLTDTDDADLCADVEAALLCGEEYVGGGGASPIFMVRLAKTSQNG